MAVIHFKNKLLTSICMVLYLRWIGYMDVTLFKGTSKYLYACLSISISKIWKEQDIICSHWRFFLFLPFFSFFLSFWHRGMPCHLKFNHLGLETHGLANCTFYYFGLQEEQLLTRIWQPFSSLKYFVMLVENINVMRPTMNVLLEL